MTGSERRTVVRTGVFVLMAAALLASDVPRIPTDLASASIEELLRIPVTTVSKREQELWKTPAAVYVLSREDIRRSGMTSIPELLRLIPGLHVARIIGNVWSVSARGFSGRYSDKLLVMIDRRSVYSPIYGGVDWDLQDVFVEDIERIEVVRGPGGTMWGANAVNGVVHIITKSAHDTHGLLVTAGAGTETRQAGVRYGGRIGRNADFRAYAKFTDYGALQLYGAGPAADNWDIRLGGFRMDWDRTDHDSFMLEGAYYDTAIPGEQQRPTLSPPFRTSVSTNNDREGLNLLGRWRFKRSDRSEFTLQAYYDRVTESGERPAKTEIGDFDFQHRWQINKRHELLWGLGTRSTSTDLGSSFVLSFTPERRVDALLTGFVQDDITLVPERLQLTLGSKVEHNTDTSGQFQPSVRLEWTPGSRHTVWAAYSRAVSTPSRTRSDIRINTNVFPMQGGLGVNSLIGSDDYRSPIAKSSELGYRVRASKTLSFDFASFFTRYSRLQTLETGTPFVESDPSPVHTVYPQYFANKMTGQTFGTEVVANWAVAKPWTLTGWYSWLKIDARHEKGLTKNPVELEGSSPSHQASLRSQMNIRGLEFDTSAYYVGALPAIGIPAYLRTDARVGWRTHRGLEFSVVGQNLLDNRHPEYLQSDRRFPLTEVGRSVQARIVWRFRE